MNTFISELTIFFRVMWTHIFEWVIVAVLIGISGFIEFAIKPREMIAAYENYEIRNPYKGETINNLLLFAIAIVLPCAILFLLTLLHPRKFEFSNAILSLIEALSVSLLIVQVLKVYVGRPRPNHFSYCGYNTDSKKCEGKKKHIRDSYLSFPSGHSAVSFTSATWLFMFFNSYYKKTEELWWTMLKLIPVFVAIFIATSRIVDYMHHVSDVITGVVLGIGIAHIIYKSQKERILNAGAGKSDAEIFSQL